MSFRNRCLVVGANGVQALTVPVEGGREQKAVYKDIRIDEQGDWRKRHWRTLFSAYGKAPFFEYYAADLEALFQVKTTFLVDWNLTVLDWLSSRLRILMPLVLELGAESAGTYDLDLTDRIKPSNYANDIAGISPPVYAQVFQERHGFLPNLSVLDMLLCAGPEAGRMIRDSVLG